MNSPLRQLVSLIAGSVCCLACAQHPGYETHDVMDTQGSGGLAMRFEIPKGWTAKDAVFWNLNLRLNPMSYSITTSSPDRQTWISYLSGLTFGFSSNGDGSIQGRVPPKHASDFLIQDFEQVHAHTEYQIVSREDDPIPYPFKPSNPNVTVHAVHSSVTVKFTLFGVDTVEKLSQDFYGYIRSFGPGRFSGNWFISGLTVVNAPDGHLADAEQICGSVLASERMTTSFSQKYQQVCKLLLEKTQEEGAAARRQAQVIISSGGGRAHPMDKDTFIMHEELKGLRSQLFSRSIGN